MRGGLKVIIGKVFIAYCVNNLLFQCVELVLYLNLKKYSCRKGKFSKRFNIGNFFFFNKRFFLLIDHIFIQTN